MDPIRFPKSAPIQPLDDFSVGQWLDKRPPPYDWIVDGCLLRGTVAMLSGDGGLGKSLLMQQLLSACAAGKPWMGLDTTPGRVYGVFCEDDQDELHRRQEDINRHYGIDYSAIAETAWYSCRVGQDNVLVDFDRRTERMNQTVFCTQIFERLKEIQPTIVVFDTVADVFNGDEIRRTQVRRFVSLLRQLAMQLQCGIIVTAHPSLTGMNTGTGLSGSTAWNNSVRSRLYLTRTAAPGSDDDQNPNERFLKTMKNNQGPFGGKIRIEWQKGVFVRTDIQTTFTGNVVDRLDIDQRLCDELRRAVENGAFLSADPNPPTSFANKIRRTPRTQHLSFAAVVEAQERLISAGRIVRVEMGPPSKRRVYLRPADMRFPGETDGETE